MLTVSSKVRQNFSRENLRSSPWREALGGSSTHSSRCGIYPVSVHLVEHRSGGTSHGRICGPPRGRGGAGWFQHPQLALWDMPSPFPPSPPVRLPFPRRPIVVNAVPHKQASGTLCSKTLRIFRSVGPAPPAQYKQVIQALRRRLLCKYRCVSESRGNDGWKWCLAGTMDGNGAGGLRNGGWGSVGGAWAPRACHTP